MVEHHDLLIVGAGRLAVDVADLIEDVPGHAVIGFVVDQPPFVHGSTLAGKPIYWIDELTELGLDCKAVCAIGSTSRVNIIQRVEAMGIEFVSVIHPSARVSKAAQIGAGSIISSGVQIAAETRIGRHVIVNRGALVGPFTVIEDFCYVAPGANMAANITVGRQTWIGLGANVLEYLSIGTQCIIGAGSLVTRDVPDRVKVVGSPAVIVEKDINGM